VTTLNKFIEVADQWGLEGIMINTMHILRIFPTSKGVQIFMTDGAIVNTSTDYVTLFEELQ
jgi:hypothetical protein